MFHLMGSSSSRSSRRNHSLMEQNGDGSSSSSSNESESMNANHLVTILQYLIRSQTRNGLLDDEESYGDTSDRRMASDNNDSDDEVIEEEDEGRSEYGSDEAECETEERGREWNEKENNVPMTMSSSQVAEGGGGAGIKRSTPLINLLSKREVGMFHSEQFSQRDKCCISSRFIPNTKRVLFRYSNKVFCGTHSQNGDLLLTACQDCKIRLYDTTRDDYKLFKSIKARDVGWSILDTAFSPDGNHFVYSSWSECFHLCNIYGDHEKHDALPLCPENRRFCIFSLIFSQDGQEVLGGANDGYLYIYNIERKERNLKINSHDNDVNTVAYADASSHILFSGGDDGLCKVWDRRTLDESRPRPVGVLAGHRDGITHIDPRGDGRHLITNSKDQRIKLWDMRVFSPWAGIECTRRAINKLQWDYRWQKVPKNYDCIRRNLPGDTSLMTYSGHCVLKTLIRSRFSPAHSTGQRYIYTGCATGTVWIYDVLTGKVVESIRHHNSCVRDVSWHPYRPEIASTCWDGTVSLIRYEQEFNFDLESELGVTTGRRETEVTRNMQNNVHAWRSYNLRQRPRMST